MTDDLKEPVYDTSERNARIEWEHNTVYCTDALRWAKHRIEQLEREIQRLRMALADTEALEIGTGERCTALLADNTRLRDALEFAASIIGHPDDEGSKLIATTLASGFQKDA